jgi:hypothetical protein
VSDDGWLCLCQKPWSCARLTAGVALAQRRLRPPVSPSSWAAATREGGPRPTKPWIDRASTYAARCALENRRIKRRTGPWASGQLGVSDRRSIMLPVSTWNLKARLLLSARRSRVDTNAVDASSFRAGADRCFAWPWVESPIAAAGPAGPSSLRLPSSLRRRPGQSEHDGAFNNRSQANRSV